ncbi:MAG: hypothetical protein RIN55_07220 [Tissierellaceae bacterium]|nr:hypothetical protein [Tissierellaceae bacterium]
MFYKKKLDKMMEWLKNKNQDSDSDEKIEDFKFDKTDILALIISALLVFGPVFIILIIILIFLF